MSNVSLVESLYEAFTRGDIPAVLASFHPKIAWREAESNPYQPGGEAWIGPEAVLENLFVHLGADWDGFTVHPKSFHDADGTVVVEGRYSGTHKATGRQLDCQMCHVWKIEEGAVTSFQQYTDTSRMRSAMGV